MNEEKWLFIGTDQRLFECSKIMANRGSTCLSIKTNSYTPELEAALTEFTPDHIVFPILEMGGAIPLHLIGEGTNLYTGVVSEKWLEPYKLAGFTVESYLREELFVWENAWLTAEAFLLEFYAKTGRTIVGKQFHVAGYGRVGKMIAQILSSIGGHVSIIARSDEQLSEAKVRGFQVEPLSDKLNVGNSYLVNTIPTQWFSAEQNLPFFIFDLASAPGCLEQSLPSEYYTLLPGLPGKYFPVDAARVLADALERIHQG